MHQQYLLLELARNQTLQERVRVESSQLLGKIEASGCRLCFEDLPRFDLLTRCIAETLRIWNVASITFARALSFPDKASHHGLCPFLFFRAMSLVLAHV